MPWESRHDVSTPLHNQRDICMLQCKHQLLFVLVICNGPYHPLLSPIHNITQVNDGHCRVTCCWQPLMKH